MENPGGGDSSVGQNSSNGGMSGRNNSSNSFELQNRSPPASRQAQLRNQAAPAASVVVPPAVVAVAARVSRSSSNDYYTQQAAEHGQRGIGGGDHVSFATTSSTNISSNDFNTSPELESPPVSAALAEWSTVETAPGQTPPCARSLHSAAMKDGTLYIFGGYNGHARVNDFHAFSFMSRRWSPVLASAHSARPPSPRDRHISVVYDSNFYGEKPKNRWYIILYHTHSYF